MITTRLQMLHNNFLLKLGVCKDITNRQMDIKFVYGVYFVQNVFYTKRSLTQLAISTYQD